MRSIIHAPDAKFGLLFQEHVGKIALALGQNHTRLKIGQSCLCKISIERTKLASSGSIIQVKRDIAYFIRAPPRSKQTETGGFHPITLALQVASERTAGAFSLMPLFGRCRAAGWWCKGI